MTPSEVLRDAAKLVRKGWCKGASARSRLGTPVPDDSGLAVKWCGLGAICCASGNNEPLKWDAIHAMGAFTMNAYGLSITEFNDQYANDGAEVAAHLEHAAQLSERSGG